MALFITPTRTASLSQLFLMDKEEETIHTNYPNATEGAQVYQSLPLCIIARESYETSKGHGEGKEDLSGSIQPHLRVLQDLPLQTV